MTERSDRATIPAGEHWHSLMSFCCVGWHFFCIVTFQLLVIRRAAGVLGDELGHFLYLYAVASVSIALSLVGLQSVLMRFLSVNKALGHRSASVRILSLSFGVRLVLLLLACACFVIFVKWQNAGEEAHTILWCCGFLFLQGMLLLMHAALQGLGQYGFLAMISTCLFLGLVVPCQDLADLFMLMSVCYGISFLGGTVVLLFVMGRHDVSESNAPVLSLAGLIRFSGVVSLAAFFVLAFDNAGVIMLRNSYPGATFKCLALAFTLLLYPSRINALSEAMILPQLSSVYHAKGREKASDIFGGWIRIMHLGGLLLTLGLVLLMPLIVRILSQGNDLSAAVTLAELLMFGLFVRTMLPVFNSVLIVAERPRHIAAASGTKLVLDLLIIFLLRGREPVILVSALLITWVIYGEISCILARRELGLRMTLDAFILLVPVAGASILLFVPHVFARIGFSFLLFSVLCYTTVSARRLSSEVL